MNQKTIKNRVTFTGVGIHTGEPSCVILKPASPNSGISLNGHSISVDVAEYVGYATAVHGVKMVEHLLGFFYLSGITNCKITCDSGELPILDGGAADYFKKVEVVEQTESVKTVKISRSIDFSYDQRRQYNICPSDHTTVTLFLEYQKVVLSQKYTLPLPTIGEFFASKTFCFRDQITHLQNLGLIRGGNEHNALVIEDDSMLFKHKTTVLNHKLLDFFGDFSIMGAYGNYDITIYNPGHESNIAFIRHLHEQFTR